MVEEGDGPEGGDVEEEVERAEREAAAKAALEEVSGGVQRFPCSRTQLREKQDQRNRAKDLLKEFAVYAVFLSLYTIVLLFSQAGVPADAAEAGA